MKYLIANWKQNGNIEFTKNWINGYYDNHDFNIRNKVNVIVCPPFPLVYVFKECNLQKPKNFVKVGVQDISSFKDGPHTGETGVGQLSTDVKYIIVGHSERRKRGESPKLINEKLEMLIGSDKTPIVCFSSIEEFNMITKYTENMLFAYEPVDSIGTGNPASIESLHYLKDKTGLSEYIYGGSIDKNNFADYLSIDFINGFLVGGASLDPISFASLTDQIFETYKDEN
jgi:triosephosphate isomerase (TIM)